MMQYAHAIDNDELERWPQFFTRMPLPGHFAAGTRAGAVDRGVVLRHARDAGRPGEFDPRGQHLRAARLSPRHRPDRVLDFRKGRTRRRRATSWYAQHDGEMLLFSAGRYVDEIVIDGGAARFRKRVVVVRLVALRHAHRHSDLKTAAMPRKDILHLHLESFRQRPALFHLTDDRWQAAARLHGALAKRLRVTVGWDGDILDEALRTADVMINSSPPKERLRQRAPKLKWIQATGAGIDGLLPLDWLPTDRSRSPTTSGAHSAKAEDSCTMAIALLNARLPHQASQRNRAGSRVKHHPGGGHRLPSSSALAILARPRAARQRSWGKGIAVTRGEASAPRRPAVPLSQIDRVLRKPTS